VSILQQVDRIGAPQAVEASAHNISRVISPVPTVIVSRLIFALIVLLTLLLLLMHLLLRLHLLLLLLHILELLLILLMLLLWWLLELLLLLGWKLMLWLGLHRSARLLHHSSVRVLRRNLTTAR